MELPVREEEDDDVLCRLRRKAKKPAKCLNKDLDLNGFSKSHVLAPESDLMTSEEYRTAMARNKLRTVRYQSAPVVDRKPLSNEAAQQKVLARLKQSKRKTRRRRHVGTPHSDRKSTETAPKISVDAVADIPVSQKNDVAKRKSSGRKHGIPVSFVDVPTVSGNGTAERSTSSSAENRRISSYGRISGNGTAEHSMSSSTENGRSSNSKRISGNGAAESSMSSSNERYRRSPHHKKPDEIGELIRGLPKSSSARSRKDMETRGGGGRPDFHSSCPTFNTPSIGILAVSSPTPSKRGSLPSNSPQNSSCKSPGTFKDFAANQWSPHNSSCKSRGKFRDFPAPPYTAINRGSFKTNLSDESGSIGHCEGPFAYVYTDNPSIPGDLTVVFESEDIESYFDNKAIVIQMFWRMVQAKTKLERSRKAAITIQSRFRAATQQREYLKDLSEDIIHLQRHAATLIQSVTRGMLARIDVQVLFEVERNAAIKIQSLVRMSIAKEIASGARRKLLRSRKVERCPGDVINVKEACSGSSSTLATEATETSRSSLADNATRIAIENQYGEKGLDDSALFLPSPLPCPASCTIRDTHVPRAALHAQLLAFESRRKSVHKPKLKSTFLQWRNSIDSLDVCQREMMYAERLVYGSLAANQAYADSMHAIHNNGRRGSKKKQPISPSDNLIMLIADEISAVREELKTQVDTLNELGDDIIAELESSEMGIVEAWDAYDATCMESVRRSQRNSTTASNNSKNQSQLVESCTDLWLTEMRYRVSVAFQALAWKRTSLELSQVFETASRLEQKHRSQLCKLLTDFASKHQQELSREASIETSHEHVDQIHPQIEELIHDLKDQTAKRPAVAKAYSFINLRDITMLESPMVSRLLLAAKVVELRTKSGVGRRTCWERFLAVVTEDGFLHLFDVPPSSTVSTTAEEVFLDLVRASQSENLTSAKGVFKHLPPTESLFLPNCVVDSSSKETSDFEIKEDYLGKLNKIAMRRLVFRTSSPEETIEWVETLHASQGDDFLSN